MSEKPKTVLEILSRPIVNLFMKVNKRLRFSITFKTTALYALNFFLSLLRIGVVFALCFALFLIFRDYRDMARVAEGVGELLISGQISDGEIETLSKISDNNISVSDAEGATIHISENRFENQRPAVDADKFWQYGNLPWFRDNMPHAFYIDLTGRYMAVMIDVYEPENIAQGNPEGEGTEVPGATATPRPGREYGAAATLQPGVVDEPPAYTVEVYRSIQDEWAAVQLLSAGMGILFLISLIGIARKGARQTRRMLSPIHDMTQAARSISYHELHTRLNPINTHDELKELAETFNEMLDRIQATSVMQNRFVSDASHELRTPVTVIQGYANMLSRWGNDDKEVLDESITAIKGESESMKALLESLLFLTRAEKDTQRVEKAVFSLDELIDEVAKETRMIDHAHRITGFIEKGIGLDGDRGLIKQAVRVFVENAMKYTPAGGTITISCYLDIEENKPKYTKQKRKKEGHASEALLSKLRQAGFIVDFENGFRITYDKNSRTADFSDQADLNIDKNGPSPEANMSGEIETASAPPADERAEPQPPSDEQAGAPPKSPKTHVLLGKKELEAPPENYRGAAVIVVSDTGVGIAPGDIPHIFDRFYRCDESRTRESGGTGLGLSIAKWIIERHLGDITVQSKVGVGTRITIQLPDWRVI